MQHDTAVSKADDKAAIEDIRTYFREVCRTSTGINAAARLFDAARKIPVMTVPSTVCTTIMVYDRLNREVTDLADLSPITSQADLGKPSFKTWTITPI